MSTNHCARTSFWWVCACAPHFWFLHLANCHFTLHLPPLQCPGMCIVENFQRLIFGNSYSPNKFKVHPKRDSLPTRSQEGVKHKSTLTFTFTLRTIYEVNDTAWYLEMCWPSTDNDEILSTLFHHEEDNVLKMTVKNRSKIDHSKSVPNNWYISSLQE